MVRQRATGTGVAWSEDPSARHFANPWVQAGAINPSAWMGQMSYTLPTNIPTSTTIDTNQLPVSIPHGYKLVQDSVTGQFMVIPSNIDLFDPSRMWSGFPSAATHPGAIQQILAAHHTQMQHHVLAQAPDRQPSAEFAIAYQARQDAVIACQDLSQGGVNGTGGVNSQTNSTQSTGSLDHKEVLSLQPNDVSGQQNDKEKPVNSQQNIPDLTQESCTPLPEIVSIKTEMSSVQSREKIDNLKHSENPDTKSENKDKEQNPKNDIANSDACEISLNSEARAASESAHILAGLSCTNVVVSSNVSSCDQKTKSFDNSSEKTYNPFLDPQILQAADGLELLSALAEKRAKCEDVTDFTTSDNSTSWVKNNNSKNKESVCMFSDDEPPKTKRKQSISRTRSVPAVKPETKLETPSYYTSTGLRIPQDLESFLEIGEEEINAIELDMRIRLAELQRQYKEKQREFARLTPKRDKEKDVKQGQVKPKEPPIKKKKQAEELVDRVFRKTGGGFGMPLSKKLKANAMAALYKTQSGFTMKRKGSTSSSSSMSPLSTPDEKPVDSDGLGMLAKYAVDVLDENSTPVKKTIKRKVDEGVCNENTQTSSNENTVTTCTTTTTTTTTIPTNNKPKDSDAEGSSDSTSPSNKKRKPGRPRKCIPNKTHGVTETIVAKNSKNFRLYQLQKFEDMWNAGVSQPKPKKKQVPNIPKKKPKKPISKEIISDSDSSSDGDNIPLSALRERPQTPVPRSCVISQDELKDGLRVLLFKDGLFYEGAVLASPNPHADKNFINVEFDDGDSGRIPLDHIRMIPEDFPIVSYDPNPLLLIGKRRRHTTSDSVQSIQSLQSLTPEFHRSESLQPSDSKTRIKRGPGRPPKQKSENGLQNTESMNIDDDEDIDVCGLEEDHDEGALFQSPHIDENDVQTISHKCDVLSFTEYKKRHLEERRRGEHKTVDDSDIYYLAGTYEPTIGLLKFQDDIM
ncbi:hypothetical protein KUTeg_004346 [Tegillarca granosa]|uniref:BAH domain-containing protein n=1 Tax=Tegillarca granosa TaxID=220873 RepID=A0ABQ9FSK5_TEGGR|nr:hypothetical protein KUTeg_004346 [Tegillarca granosa]